MQVGVISDTHGLLRPEAIEALQGVDCILHAGDVGDPDIITRLSRIAPTKAIRGNVDIAAWAADLPDTMDVTLAGHRIHMRHDLKTLDLDPARGGIGIVISGHSHKPELRHEGGVLYLNPGAAGKRRFRLPVTLAQLTLNGTPEARILDLI